MYQHFLTIYSLSSSRVGTFGFTTEYGAEKRISKYSSVVANISIGVPSGVFLKLKVIRSSQTFIFPIHISEEIIPAAVFYATATPILVWFVVKKVIIDPMNADQKRREVEKAREGNKQRMAEKKREAESSIELMSATLSRIQEDETKRHGLVILSAVYGKLDDDETERVDVTIPLQCLVKGSKLILFNGSKCDLPGFYDPCAGEEKRLQIEYLYRDLKYDVNVADEDALRIPMSLPVSPDNS